MTDAEMKIMREMRRELSTFALGKAREGNPQARGFFTMIGIDWTQIKEIPELNGEDAVLEPMCPPDMTFEKYKRFDAGMRQIIETGRFTK